MNLSSGEDLKNSRVVWGVDRVDVAPALAEVGRVDKTGALRPERRVKGKVEDRCRRKGLNEEVTLQLGTEWKGAPAEGTADAKARRLLGRSEGRLASWGSKVELSGAGEGRGTWKKYNMQAQASFLTPHPRPRRQWTV